MTDPRRVAIETFNKGLELIGNDPAMAYSMIASSVDVDPTFKEGWAGTGNVAGDNGMAFGAIADYRRVIELDPNDAKAMVNLGHRLYHTGRIEEAEHVTRRAVKLDPSLIFGWTNLSMIVSVQGKNTMAVEIARKAVAMMPDDYDDELRSQVDMQLAFALLYAGFYAEGLKAFHARFPYRLKSYLHYPYPEWQGDEVDTLFAIADQGIGDALCYSRFVPAAAARCKRMILGVHPELVRLMRACLQDHQNIDVVPLPSPFPAADAWITLTSLPIPLGLNDQQIELAPWLAMPGFKLPATWKVPGRKLHVGICWAGAPGNDVDKWRTMRPELFLDLVKVPGIQLYSLQIGDAGQQLHQCGGVPVVKDLRPHVRDVADTMALMRDLDMIVGIETSLHWMAAMAGKEYWMLYSYNGGDYRIGRNRQRALWAPHTRIYKGGANFDWQPAMDRVVFDLHRKLDRMTREAAE